MDLQSDLMGCQPDSQTLKSIACYDENVPVLRKTWKKAENCSLITRETAQDAVIRMAFMRPDCHNIYGIFNINT